MEKIIDLTYTIQYHIKLATGTFSGKVTVVATDDQLAIAKAKDLVGQDIIYRNAELVSAT